MKEGRETALQLAVLFRRLRLEKLPGHEDRYYLHVFHKNSRISTGKILNSEIEIYKMINWWLDKGLAGFRIDAIINIKKTLPFP